MRRRSPAFIEDVNELLGQPSSYGRACDAAGVNAGTVMAQKLLMIDDEVGVTKVVGMIARQLGMEFRALNTPDMAAEVFIDFQPDVVIIDMIMPDRDGIDVLNEIMLTGIPTRIVLTTGHGKAYLRLAEGVAQFHGGERLHFLEKPFRRAELVELLTNITNTQPLGVMDPSPS
jgi:DNA-binding NtrC family response regulator